MIYTCHCNNYQHFYQQRVLPRDVDGRASLPSDGEPRAMLHTAESGRNVSRWVCPECGSRISSGASTSPFRNVRAGTLHDTSWLRPTVHFWTRSKQPWIILPDERSHLFETQPDDPLAFFNSLRLAPGASPLNPDGNA